MQTITTNMMYLHSGIIVDVPHGHELKDNVATLHPFSSKGKVEHWKPSRIYARIPPPSRNDPNNASNEVVFGVASEDDVIMLGWYRFDSGQGKNVALYRDGGSLETKVGIRTVPGPEVVHVFAVFGDNITTESMRASTRKMLKLTHPQIARLFGQVSMREFTYISEIHARRVAMSRLRKARSRRSSK